MPVLNAITHNHYRYRDEKDPVSIRLREMLNELRSACEAAGITPVGATLREIADDVLALPVKKEPFVCEGAILEPRIGGSKRNWAQRTGGVTSAAD